MKLTRFLLLFALSPLLHAGSPPALAPADYRVVYVRPYMGFAGRFFVIPGAVPARAPSPVMNLEQVLRGAYNSSAVALNANGGVNPNPLSCSSPTGADQIMACVYDPTNHALFVNVLAGGSGATFKVNGTNTTSQTTINFQNSAAFNGLTFTFANPSVGNVQLGASGTLTDGGISSASTWNAKQAALSTSAAVTHQFVTGFTAPNTFTRAQPSCADLSDAGAGCSGSGGGISGLTAGTLPAAATSSTIANTNPAITEQSGVGHTFPGVNVFPATSTTTTPVFTGSGLNDFTLSGTYLCGETLDYVIQIDSTGTPDTFDVSRDSGSTFFTAGQPVTSIPTLVECGLSVAWGATTGHTLNASWASTASATIPVTVKNADGTLAIELRQDRLGVEDPAGNIMIGGIGVDAAGGEGATGSDDIGIGVHAMENLTSGTSNTGVGSGALQNDTTGSSNTAIGDASLISNTTGNNNTSVGVALGANTTGSGNTAVGNGAGVGTFPNTVGDNNTYIGLLAVPLANNLSNAMALGANAQVDASNKVRIGDDNVTAIELGGPLAVIQSSGASFQVSTGATALTSLVGISNDFLGGYKAPRALTAVSITGSAAALSVCTTDPEVTFFECGTSATCASPTTIGTVTVSAANTITAGTISNAAIASGDFVVAELTAGACTSLTDLAATMVF